MMMRQTLISMTAATLYLLGLAASAQQTDETGDDPAVSLSIPGGLSAPQLDEEAAGKFIVREEFVGGRRERVTLIRGNGDLVEVYKNRRNSVLWHGPENELGDDRNVRQWRVGTW